MGDERPPLEPGTCVKTKEANWGERENWTHVGWNKRQWGVEGVIVTHDDSDSLIYEVKHPDGTIGCYDPSEIEVVSESTIQKKTVCLIGDSSHRVVSKIITALQEENIEVTVAHAGDRFNIALLCLTEKEMSREMWQILATNRDARVIPVIFEGGVLPALYADIRPADCASNGTKGLKDLTTAVRRFFPNST